MMLRSSHFVFRVVSMAFALLITCVAVAGAQTSGQPQAASPRAGILLMAHGGSTSWNDQVRAVAAETDKTMPTEVAFGMADRSTLQAGIDKLAARGVTAIVAVPLFVSSHSSVIESTKYLLGLRADAPAELADFAMMGDMDHGADDHGAAMDHGMPGAAGHDAMPATADEPAKDAGLPKPVVSSVPVRMAAALDRHPIVADILADRAAAMGKDPAHEALILVAHGPNSDEENAQWLADMHALADRIASRAHYARIDCVTLRDDAPSEVRDKATTELRQDAEAANDAGYHVLVTPLLLSYGGIENGLRQRLDGIQHALSPQALLPDARIATWVVDSARATEAVASR
jgi:sirohydrochlorin ferrochelatase